MSPSARTRTPAIESGNMDRKDVRIGIAARIEAMVLIAFTVSACA